MSASVGDELLEPAVLLLELREWLHVCRRQAAEVFPPA
jgi:hypothetical protein